MDNDGYPTEEELKEIREWPAEKGYAALLQHVGEMVEQYGWHRQRGTYHWISTGGWSGNEDIISALDENIIFWSTCWQQSRRGGHYKFRVPRRPKKTRINS